MSRLIIEEDKLAFDEIKFKCPHCNKHLIEKLDIYANDNLKLSKDSCPCCGKHI